MFLATGGLAYYFSKFHDFPMIIHVFSNSMIFPCMELFLVIFQVVHYFQSLWEPRRAHLFLRILCIYKLFKQFPLKIYSLCAYTKCFNEMAKKNAKLELRSQWHAIANSQTNSL